MLDSVLSVVYLCNMSKKLTIYNTDVNLVVFSSLLTMKKKLMLGPGNSLRLGASTIKYYKYVNIETQWIPSAKWIG